MVAPVEGVASITQVTAGTYHTCAAARDGSAFCWGRNHRGQLGDGTIADESRPTPSKVVGLTGVTEIAAGAEYTCAVATDGIARCWGGTPGSTSDQASPTEIGGLGDVTALSPGANHVCALTADGSVYCWGANTFGELGDDAIGDESATPVRVAALGASVRIASGAHHVCAVTTVGALWCWGQNLYQQLGHDVLTDHSVAEVADVAGVRDLAAGFGHTCVVVEDGTVLCWGGNDDGQLGDGTTLQRSARVAVALAGPVTHIAAGVRHSCALLASGAAYCWGPNVYGELGDGTTNASATPVAVMGLSEPTTP